MDASDNPAPSSSSPNFDLKLLFNFITILQIIGYIDVTNSRGVEDGSENKFES
jgi:hypothetical protein